MSIKALGCFTGYLILSIQWSFQVLLTTWDKETLSYLLKVTQQEFKSEPPDSSQGSRVPSKSISLGELQCGQKPRDFFFAGWGVTLVPSVSSCSPQGQRPRLFHAVDTGSLLPSHSVQARLSRNGGVLKTCPGIITGTQAGLFAPSGQINYFIYKSN